MNENKKRRKSKCNGDRVNSFLFFIKFQLVKKIQCSIKLILIQQDPQLLRLGTDIQKPLA